MTRGVTRSTINPKALKAEYAVRGPIVTRSQQIEADLKAGKGSYPFKRIIACNIGNPQALMQKPLTFPRQVLALLASPQLLENPDVGRLFAPDVVARAKQYISGIGHWTATGAYTHSKGYAFVRKTVATFIEHRDNTSAKAALGAVDPESIFLTNGASTAVHLSLQLVVGSEADGVMVPIPQYPLYTASLALLGGSTVPYYLDESRGWGLTLAELERSVAEAKKKGTKPRAIVVINPGNPTGQVLDATTIRDILKFAYEQDIVVLADEVYQANIYVESKPFISFRQVLRQMGEPYAKDVQLVSFHTTSKGIIGECGRRGGYMQLDNFGEEALTQLTKLASINLCANVDGQLMVDLMLNPPKPGDASYDVYQKEYSDIYQSLKRRATMLVETLNNIPGMSTNVVEGAMYAFPSLQLPAKYIARAEAEGRIADEKWCMELLEATGVVVVPGSGFGQVEGSSHFRTTILPPEDQMIDVCKSIAQFHAKILKEYA